MNKYLNTPPWGGVYKETESPHIAHNERVLDEITREPHWDSDKFKLVLLSLSKVGEGTHVPARNRSESIHLQKWRPFIDDLDALTVANGREHSQAVLADIESDKLLFSGKISVGTHNSGYIDLSKQKGRERYQRVVASVHTHPEGETAHGLSTTDYKTFLTHREHQAMMIHYGSGQRIVVLKTSVTPNNLEESSIKRHANEVHNDYYASSHLPVSARVVELNRAMCREFGLVMYVASKESNDMYERVNVVD